MAPKKSDGYSSKCGPRKFQSDIELSMNRGQLISGRYPANHEQMTFSSKHKGPGQQTHDMGNPGQGGLRVTTRSQIRITITACLLYGGSISYCLKYQETSVNVELIKTILMVA